MELRQYDVDEFDFRIYNTTFNSLCNDGTLKDPRSKLPELLAISEWIYFHETHPVLTYI